MTGAAREGQRAEIADRRKKLTEIVDENPQLSVRKLAGMLNVSVSTIERDLRTISLPQERKREREARAHSQLAEKGRRRGQKPLSRSLSAEILTADEVRIIDNLKKRRPVRVYGIKRLLNCSLSEAIQKFTEYARTHETENNNNFHEDYRVVTAEDYPRWYDEYLKRHGFPGVNLPETFFERYLQLFEKKLHNTEPETTEERNDFYYG